VAHLTTQCYSTLRHCVTPDLRSGSHPDSSRRLPFVYPERDTLKCDTLSLPLSQSTGAASRIFQHSAVIQPLHALHAFSNVE
jgi:hypothetical protein